VSAGQSGGCFRGYHILQVDSFVVWCGVVWCDVMWCHIVFNGSDVMWCAILVM
jgi:hypothetical protein